MMKIELLQPQTWNDITFKQWRLLTEHMPQASDPDTILEWRIEQVHIINPHLSKDTIKRIKSSQLLEYFKTISFLDGEPVKEIWKEFQFEGNRYKLIPFEDMSLAQWIDAEKLGRIETAAELIAIFYMNPAEYDDIKRRELADFIDTQPCSRVFWLVSQFFFIQKALEMALPLYLERVKKGERKLRRTIEWSKRISRLKLFGSKSSTT